MTSQLLPPPIQAVDRGHDPVRDPPHALNAATRWTCRCGTTVLDDQAMSTGECDCTRSAASTGPTDTRVGIVEVRSLYRRIRLETPPPDDVQYHALFVPVDATDEQILGWADGLLGPEALAELRERFAREQRSA